MTYLQEQCQYHIDFELIYLDALLAVVRINQQPQPTTYLMAENHPAEAIALLQDPKLYHVGAQSRREIIVGKASVRGPNQDEYRCFAVHECTINIEISVLHNDLQR